MNLNILFNKLMMIMMNRIKIELMIYRSNKMYIKLAGHVNNILMMKIGDLVRRTYGEGKRPAGIMMGWTNARETVALVLWNGGDTYEMLTQYLEVINESR